MTEPIAVIDLGTNTFHLLIARIQGDQIQELYRERRFIKLAAEGIEWIGKEPFQRGIHCLQDYRQIIDTWQVTEIQAIGTAALRTAANGMQFIQAAQQEADIQIRLIDGEEEARLIFRGANKAIPDSVQKQVVMDIGGGSVEFILSDGKAVRWQKSFPIGVAVLYQQFHENEPITDDEIAALRQYLSTTLQELISLLTQMDIRTLVGASGTFDVLEACLPHRDQDSTHANLDLRTFLELYQRIVGATLTERFADKQIPDSRAEMITVALILIDFILREGNMRELYVSHYAVKEGVLYEVVSEQELQ